MIKLKLTYCFILISFASLAQHQYTKQDTLRGSITPERAWWDLQHYELAVTINPENKSISGSNTITYNVLDTFSIMQIDLQKPLYIDYIIQYNDTLTFKSDTNAHFIKIKQKQKKGEQHKLTVYYSGTPQEAQNAPWDGGFTWAKDENDNHFIATSCQGIGASLWWPCKDHMYDEPNKGITIQATVPKGLTAVANGKYMHKEFTDSTSTFTWNVENPINNYGVNINIGDYVNFDEKYRGIDGILEMDYWVLSYNLDTAKKHFIDAPKTIQALEHWFGPYPFYEDGYKLVEVPYLGMEHQSSVTYGNGFQKGYLGRDRSQTGWGLKFDFIIIHETGHEWFANNITYKDMADMWIHESFTTYSESLFVEYFYGKDAGAEYNRGKRALIQNQEPMITDYNVNAHPPGDVYPKGANMLHTLRQIVNNDELWRKTLIGLNRDFRHQTVTTHQIEKYLSDSLKMNLTPFFNQYLRTVDIPELIYKIDGNKLLYTLGNCVENFKYPIDVKINNKTVKLYIENNNEMNEFSVDKKIKSFEINPDYYIFKTELVDK